MGKEGLGSEKSGFGPQLAFVILIIFSICIESISSQTHENPAVLC